MSTLQINKHKSKLTFAIPLMSLAGLGTISVFVINQDANENVSATTTTISSTVNYGAYYLSIDNSSEVNLDLGTTASGAYAYASDNITVKTNVSTGYDLYISSADNSSSALMADGINTTIAATSGSGGADGVPAVLSENSYGYAVPSNLINNNNFDTSYSNPTSVSKWAAVPAGSSDLIHSTNIANEAGDTIDIHYGVFGNSILIAGDYTGSVVYSAIATTSGTVPASVRPASGSVGDALTLISGPLINSSDSLSVNDVKVTFEQGGVKLGDCNITNINTLSGHLVTTCTSPSLFYETYDVKIEVPSYNFVDVISGGYTDRTPTLASITYMQDATSAQCASSVAFDATSPTMITKTTYKLIDERDNNEYYVRKLADGNCWMVQNLRLTGTKTLTSSDSNVSSDFTLPASSKTWCTNHNDSNAQSCIDQPYTFDTNNSNDGTYYNWYAATAGSGTYSSGYNQVASSVCPKSWHLPNATEWRNLLTDGYGIVNNANDRTDFSDSTITNVVNSYGDFPPNLLFSGHYWGSTKFSSVGAWWGSNSSGNYSASRTQLYSSGSAAIGIENWKASGYSVRCLVQAAS